MSPAAALLMAAAAAVAPIRHRELVAGALGLGIWQPWLLVLGGSGAVLVFRWRRLQAARRARSDGTQEAVLFAELVALGLGAGLPFIAAAEAAAGSVPILGAEARLVVRRARVGGSPAAFAAAGGELAPLFRLASRAAVTGASLGPAVAGFVAEARKEQAAARAAAIRRLPVRLLLPLTLLILPGFVVLTLGPALLSGFERIAKGAP